MYGHSLGACVCECWCEIRGWVLAGMPLYLYQCQTCSISLLLSPSGERKLLLDTVYDGGVHSGALDKMIFL